VVTIRPFNTYGPRQSARAVIPTIITQALVRDLIYLGALTPRRDYTYVEDVVDGFLKVAETDRAIGQTINIGSSQEISIGDLAQKIINLIGRNVKIVTDKQRLRPERSEPQGQGSAELVAPHLAGRGAVDDRRLDFQALGSLPPGRVSSLGENGSYDWEIRL